MNSTTKPAQKKSVRELKPLRTSARNKAANLQCCCCRVPKPLA